MRGIIATLTWDACQHCRHMRTEGGCVPVDENSTDVFDSDMATNIYCHWFWDKSEDDHD